MHLSSQHATLSPVPAAASRQLSYQQLDVLHSLRGFCAFYVVIYHAKYILWSGGQQYLTAFPRSTWGLWEYGVFALDMLSSAGYEMVIFFFVLSGFFIRYAQLRKHRRPLDFYLNRIVRIYPPYLVAVLLSVLVLLGLAVMVPQVFNSQANRELNAALATAWQEWQGMGLGESMRTLFFLPIQKVYIGYNTVFWSLLPEALFYLCVPLAFRQVRAYYVLSLLAYLAGRVAPAYVLTQPVLNYLVTFNFYFALGVLLHDVIVGTAWLDWIRRVPGWLLLLGTALLFGAILGLIVLKLKTGSTLLASLLAILSVSALLAGKVNPRNLVMRVLHQIGLFSFSLYLYHYPLLLLCYGGLVWLTGKLFFYERYYWLAVVLVTGVCYGLYWITERVFIKYFRKV